jgi:hypothetical protein
MTDWRPRSTQKWTEHPSLSSSKTLVQLSTSQNGRSNPVKTRWKTHSIQSIGRFRLLSGSRRVLDELRLRKTELLEACSILRGQILQVVSQATPRNYYLLHHSSHHNFRLLTSFKATTTVQSSQWLNANKKSEYFMFKWPCIVISFV